MIYTTLSNDSAVTAIVSTNIVNARLIPETITSLKTINFYRTTPFNAALEYFDLTWSIDCRSDVESQSLEIADAVKDALNRENITVGGKDYYAVVSILATIPPVNTSDVYNTPVQVRLRRR